MPGVDLTGVVASGRVPRDTPDGTSAEAIMRNKHINPETHETDLLVSEAGGDHQGSHSPFGEVEFPLPPAELPYRHPTAENRPHLAGLPEEEGEG
jgi:hypothetical protein